MPAGPNPPAPPDKPFRIALITFSAPWDGNPHTGKYNLLQVRALNAIGARAEIFVCAPRVPRILEGFRPSFRRMNARPLEWSYQGVACRAVGSLFPRPQWVRWKLAGAWPRAAEALISAAFSRGLKNQLDRFAPDAMYAHDGVLFGALAQRIARRMRIPFAIIEHDPISWTLADAVGRRYAAIGRPARAVFAVGLPSLWGLRHNLGLSNGRLCPNGIARATPDQLAAPRPPKYRGKRLVLTTGSPVPSKGHVELVRAFAETKVPESLLIVVGDHQRREVLDLIDRLGISDRVERLPAMPQSDLQQYMVWADVFALPSHRESFGMVFGEAMAAGTPVILTSACGIAPHLRQGVHGWVVGVGDHEALVSALRQALTQSASERQRMGHAGRELIGDMFTWEVSARAVLAGLRGDPPPPGLEPEITDTEAMRAALPHFAGD